MPLWCEPRCARGLENSLVAMRNHIFQGCSQQAAGTAHIISGSSGGRLLFGRFRLFGCSQLCGATKELLEFFIL